MTTHPPSRLARVLAALADIGYQAALTRVVWAAGAGLLPDPLDAVGMRHARSCSWSAPIPPGRMPPPNGSALRLEPRYYWLTQVCGQHTRLPPCGLGATTVRPPLAHPSWLDHQARGEHDPVGPDEGGAPQRRQRADCPGRPIRCDCCELTDPTRPARRATPVTGHP